MESQTTTTDAATSSTAGPKEGLALMRSVTQPVLSSHARADSGTQPRLTNSPSSMFGRSIGKAPPKDTDVVEEIVVDDGIIEVLRNSKQRLKAGTLDVVLDWLLEQKYGTDVTVLKAFLLCYRIYWSPKEVWDSVISRFPFEQFLTPDCKDEEALRQRRREAVIQFIMSWIEECAIEDFFSVEGKYAPPLWKSTQEFLKKLQTQRYTNFSLQLVEKIQSHAVPLAQLKAEAQKEAEEEKQQKSLVEDTSSFWNITSSVFSLYSYCISLTSPARRAPLVEGQFGFLDILPEEVCTCLTVADFHKFRRIKLSEFLTKAWEKDPKNSKIAEIAQRFERIAFWVATEICSCQNLYQRKALIEHFIFVAEKCFLANNFHATMAIFNGLNNGAVSRLKKSWAELPYRTKEIYDKLSDFMSPLNNFRNYREVIEKLRNASKPAFPYIALLMRDITFAHENPSQVNSLWNFQKLEILGKQILDLRHFQKTPFQHLVEVDEVIHSYFRDLKVVTKEEELYNMSYAAEPREPAPAAS